jgi:predicted dehydrogenase
MVGPLMTPTVALIGANGHGRTHRRTIAELESAGIVRLVGMCDVAAVDDPPGVPVYHDHAALLADLNPDLVVVCTPPHTHLPIATHALRHGCDVLLEKPPLLDLAEHRQLLQTVAQTGRACQVGFQALGSPALAQLLDTLDRGEIGPLRTVTMVGAWKRDDSYWRRGPWVGRRSANGVRVLDGALANPFAHAVMQVLAIVRRPLCGVEVQRYRTRDIEVDDTATLRLTFDGGVRALIVVTLCAEDMIPGEIVVHGDAGQAWLEYPTDRLRLPGQTEPQAIVGRPALLANLAAHRADATVPLLAPLARTLPFTEVLEAITDSPVTAIEPFWLTTANDLPHPRLVITGITDAVRLAADRLALFSELGLPWAAPRS